MQMDARHFPCEFSVHVSNTSLDTNSACRSTCLILPLHRPPLPWLLAKKTGPLSLSDAFCPRRMSVRRSVGPSVCWFVCWCVRVFVHMCICVSTFVIWGAKAIFGLLLIPSVCVRVGVSFRGGRQRGALVIDQLALGDIVILRNPFHVCCF